MDSANLNKSTVIESLAGTADFTGSFKIDEIANLFGWAYKQLSGVYIRGVGVEQGTSFISKFIDVVWCQRKRTEITNKAKLISKWKKMGEKTYQAPAARKVAEGDAIVLDSDSDSDTDSGAPNAMTAANQKTKASKKRPRDKSSDGQNQRTKAIKFDPNKEVDASDLIASYSP